MSAIVGIYCPDGRPVDRSDLDRMVESLAHRGPDAAGAWNEGPVGLGNTLLWTTPESRREKMPTADGSGQLVLTADARIDNRRDLMASLGIAPHEQITDGGLILRAYEKWGDRCPEQLLGDFAFAIWDGRKKALFCARDHLGIKPFYYYFRADRTFAFASEIKALLCLDEVPRRLNDVKVADYLVPIFEDKASTFYLDILRLPPGHRMTVGREGLSMQSYWSLDASREVRLGSDEEYAEAFRDLFAEAVRCRLRSAFPLGAMLSGGLDSSAVACMARALLAEGDNRRIHTFSAIFDDVPECDERPYIDAVLEQGGFDPHYVHADRISPLANLDRVFWHQDEPFYAPNLFIHWGLYTSVHQQNVRVVLDGLDGDTTVSHAIPYVGELARRGRWIALAREIRGLAKNFEISPYRVFWNRAVKPLIPGPARQVWRMLRGRTRIVPLKNSTINPRFAERIGLEARARAMLADQDGPPRSAKADHHRRLATGLLPFALEVADRAAAAFSLEARYPFFDRRLIEFCLALPTDQKMHGGWTRVVMRRALAGVYPEKIRWRGGKSNLSPNFTRALLVHARPVVDEVIESEPSVLEQYVDLPALREVYRQFVSRGAEEHAMMIWKATTLALWFFRQKEHFAFDTTESDA
ncbi:asparagine synthase [candidate division BRC1 bacterium SM23_51]|nr:MAG: asparagine synthase [candidate division BRC1 bacterium SM23_51]